MSIERSVFSLGVGVFFFSFINFTLFCVLFHNYHALNCFFGEDILIIPFGALTILDGANIIQDAFRGDDPAVVRKSHWDDKIDRREIALAYIRVVAEPTHIEPLLLVWNASVISFDKGPMSEIDVCPIQTSPFLCLDEMRFKCIIHITFQECSEKILHIMRISEG